MGKETTTSISEKLSDSVFKRLQPNLRSLGLDDFPTEIMMIAYKEERMLHVLGKTEDNQFRGIKVYPFTGFSGKLGPKLKEGDKQIPEGIYQIEYLNPNSAYYLSLKVNYPNDFDKQKSKFTDLSEMGGDIFIHGKSASIGCIPIGDKGIEEVFILAERAIHKGIKVIISPRDFTLNPLYPSIENVEWEQELYQSIERELHQLKK